MCARFFFPGSSPSQPPICLSRPLFSQYPRENGLPAFLLPTIPESPWKPPPETPPLTRPYAPRSHTASPRDRQISLSFLETSRVVVCFNFELPFRGEGPLFYSRPPRLSARPDPLQSNSRLLRKPDHPSQFPASLCPADYPPFFLCNPLPEVHRTSPFFRTTF